MVFGILWFLFAVLVGVAASKYGRSGLLWTVIAIVTSPLVAGIILIVVCLPGKNKSSSQVVIDLNSSAATTKRCPFCAEIIRLEAIKCKHCGADINDTKGASEHVFTLSCYNCEKVNEIRRSTIHNFPTCIHCGKMMFDPKRSKQVDKIMSYVVDNKANIDDVVYQKIKATIGSI